MKIVWLTCTNSPQDFGAEVAGEEVMYRRLAIHLIVANKVKFIGLYRQTVGTYVKYPSTRC